MNETEFDILVHYKVMGLLYKQDFKKVAKALKHREKRYL